MVHTKYSYLSDEELLRQFQPTTELEKELVGRLEKFVDAELDSDNIEVLDEIDWLRSRVSELEDEVEYLQRVN